MLLDVNVLLALSWDQHVHHRLAHDRFRELNTWFTSPTTESGLIRLLLNERVVGTRLQGADAVGQVDAIRETPGWGFLKETESFCEPHIDVRVLMGHRQVTDFHLVNLAAANDTLLATFDAALVASLAPDDRRYVQLWTA